MSDGRNVPTAARVRSARVPWFAGAVLALAFAAVAPALGTRPTQRAPLAAAGVAPCATVTVTAQGMASSPVALYTVGAVTCAKARTLATSYFQKAANGGCFVKGGQCAIVLRGGWLCLTVLTGQEPDGSGTIGNCEKEAPPPDSALLARVSFFLAPSRPVLLHVDQFLSTNFHVWCGIDSAFGPTTTFCVTGGDLPNGPERGAFMSPSGRVRTCFVAHPGFRQECTGNFGNTDPPLIDGQQTEAHGVLCTATHGGVRCVRDSGAGKGRGFFVSRTVARRIAP